MVVRAHGFPVRTFKFPVRANGPPVRTFEPSVRTHELPVCAYELLVRAFEELGEAQKAFKNPVFTLFQSIYPISAPFWPEGGRITPSLLLMVRRRAGFEHKNKNERITMAKRDMIPRSQVDYLKWHDNLTNNVSAKTPGATDADATMLKADNDDLHARSVAAETADTASKAAHADLNTSITNSQKNARTLAGRIKKADGYTEALGDTLRIIGVEDSVDMTQQKPTLKALAKIGGVVEVGFNKMSAEGVHIFAQRDGDAGFTYLSSETHSPYVDNRPLATANKPESRRYKALFFIGKTEIGLESNVVEATAKP